MNSVKKRDCITWRSIQNCLDENAECCSFWLMKLRQVHKAPSLNWENERIYKICRRLSPSLFWWNLISPYASTYGLCHFVLSILEHSCVVVDSRNGFSMEKKYLFESCEDPTSKQWNLIALFCEETDIFLLVPFSNAQGYSFSQKFQRNLNLFGIKYDLYNSKDESLNFFFNVRTF